MRIIDVEMIDCHSPVFLGGVNFGLKVDKKSKGGTDIKFYPDATNCGTLVVIFHKGKCAFVHSWSSITVLDPSVLGIEFPKPQVAGPLQRTVDIMASEVIRAQAGGPGDVLASRTRPNVTAQVETPISKVQGKPGRRPKYQGEESQGE